MPEAEALDRPRHEANAGVIHGAPSGVDTRILAALAAGGDVIHVAADDRRLSQIVSLVGFFRPDAAVLAFPAWDCLPYDRASPNAEILAARASTLARLAGRSGGKPRLIVTTVSAALQRVPPAEAFHKSLVALQKGRRTPMEAVLRYLRRQGYRRVGTAREPGEYALRGGLLDVYPPGLDYAVRLDFFGDDLESIRRFDPMSQRTIRASGRVVLRPVSELVLTGGRVTRFRESYRAAFTGDPTRDPLYEAISAGQAFPGMEHWLPLFYDRMATLFDYAPDARVTLDFQTDEAVAARFDTIADYFDARRSHMEQAPKAGGQFVYKPVPPDRFFLDAAEWAALLRRREALTLSPFAAPEGAAPPAIDGLSAGRAGRNFADARAVESTPVAEAVCRHIEAFRHSGRPVVLVANSAGSGDRLAHLLEEAGGLSPEKIERWDGQPEGLFLAVAELDRGFETDDLVVITEQDIFGERMRGRARRDRRAETFLSELSALNEGDLVVHREHGIGRYEGLETVAAGGADHDCLRLTYQGGDTLFVPAENMEVLSRFGSASETAALDRLGAAAWQARKSRVKDRIAAMAGQLIAIAAQRELRKAPVVGGTEGPIGEFSGRFPFTETDDQIRAIDETMADLASGKPMDRLVCGDVGFGKTEVALRAAFAAVMAGLQVAVVVPTTLLARQHFQTFRERFAGFPVRVGQLSRLVAAGDAARTRKDLEAGTLDIVVGTHALLGKSVRFRSLGLVVVDEEQHFGVAQKERLKELRADVHVLTLTATPIPRTLQMALAGVRDLSLIATPPVDRLAVRTFVLPYDPVVIEEALRRELLRGGQVFWVCPRIRDLERLAERVQRLAPGVRYAIAHGQMAPADLEAVMARFYDGEVRVLLSTNIIESGLDIPTVNTIVLHRADRFGLAQLYQLRGRVGRSKTRAYAYLTLPEDRKITGTALKRLEVMQTLDTLGAGFSLASHDMDIRGAGNLLGEEQSGHVREVGIELYQQMLEEAVAEAKAGGGDAPARARWSPQINLGASVLIPESYVPDLAARLALYRRVSDLDDPGELDAFAAELVDRFGAQPPEVENLIETVAIKQLCYPAHVAKIDAGPKGAAIAFHDDMFPNPDALVAYVAGERGTVSLRPDRTLLFRRNWADAAARMRGAKTVLKILAGLAGGGPEGSGVPENGGDGP
ncbi:MAG: transcription-repair coupling factor [Rhodospirillaceae bacterium]|nr:transcription-repair coupling factor [Rhodospirillaceae bacterium]